MLKIKQRICKVGAASVRRMLRLPRELRHAGAAGTPLPAAALNTEY